MNDTYNRLPFVLTFIYRSCAIILVTRMCDGNSPVVGKIYDAVVQKGIKLNESLTSDALEASVPLDFQREDFAAAEPLVCYVHPFVCGKAMSQPCISPR